MSFLEFIYEWPMPGIICAIGGFAIGYLWRGLEVIRWQYRAERAEDNLEFISRRLK